MTRERVGLVAAALLLALFAGVAISRSSAVATEERVWAQMKDSLAYIASVEIAPLRKEKEAAEVRAREAERGLATMRSAARVVLVEADTIAARSMEVLRDSAATVPQLRGALFVQVATTERLAAEFRAYLQADSSAHVAMDAERTATARVLAQTETALTAMTQARDAWRGAATCKVRLLVASVRCPTRTQSFVGGVLVTAAVVVALR